MDLGVGIGKGWNILGTSSLGGGRPGGAGEAQTDKGWEQPSLACLDSPKQLKVRWQVPVT